MTNGKPIAELVREEDAARKKWEAETECGGYTVAALREAFERVEDKKDWRLPVEKPILVIDMPITAVAIEFFTGSKARFTHLDKNNCLVRALGYYHGPVGDSEK